MGAGESSHREASARKTGTRQQRPDLRNKVKIATWNTLTLAKPGHQEVLIQELGRMHIDIAGITEARLTDSGCSIIDDYTIFHSGGAHHMRGVALVITTALARSFRNGSQYLTACCSPGFLTVMALSHSLWHTPDRGLQSGRQRRLLPPAGFTVQCSHPHDQLIILGDINAVTGAERTGYEHVIGPMVRAYQTTTPTASFPSARHLG